MRIIHVWMITVKLITTNVYIKENRFIAYENVEM